MAPPLFQTGLVVGKFSPLHRGHEMLLFTAQSQCDRLVVISYSKPEFRVCDANRRRAWLQELFPATTRVVLDDATLRRILPDAPPSMSIPANDAPDDDHRDFVALVLAGITETAIDAVFTSETYGGGFAARLTERLRPLNPDLVPVVHVSVDPGRHIVPIAATQIRADVHAHRNWLSPCVYASFVKRVCILGGESSGKSFLARTLASVANTVSVSEYGRELWVSKHGRLDYDDMLHIAERQVAREEEAARRANRTLFCDTSPLTTLFYSREMFGRADPLLEQLSLRAYDLFVLCEPDFPFAQDGTRVGESFRQHQHAWYVEQLAARSIPYVAARGPVDARVTQVLAALDENGPN